jgi:hypothetical protein
MDQNHPDDVDAWINQEIELEQALGILPGAEGKEASP